MDRTTAKNVTQDTSLIMTIGSVLHVTSVIAMNVKLHLKQMDHSTLFAQVALMVY